MPPFTGGFVGYFAYAMIAHAEPKLHISRGDFKDYDLMLFDKVIAYDQLRQKIVIVANVSTKGDIRENYENALSDLSAIIHMIQGHTEIGEEEAYSGVIP